MYCKHCKRSTTSSFDETTSMLSCDNCGRVVVQNAYSDEPTFTKGAGGDTQMAGSIVRSIQSNYSESFERSLNNGKAAIRSLSCELMNSNADLEKEALSYYEMAAEKGFTRGRRTEYVAASCLYIACRVNEKPYLLIDFSEKLGINVYVLGAVFLQLCQLLRLQEHPIVQKPIDPCLFIKCFTDRLMLGGRNSEGHLFEYRDKTKVSDTALRIIASMKRDWMQTGRKPSGLCGAAIYISALSEGFIYSKSDVVRVVHVCEATLTKRLIEFENTDSGSLTIEEFNKNALELEKLPNKQKVLADGSKSSVAEGPLCQHKDRSIWAHGLCEACYDEFIKLAGGLHGGSDPPAFQHAERERAAENSAEKAKESDVVRTPHQVRTNDNHTTKSKIFVDSENDKAGQNVNSNGKGDLVNPELRNATEDEVLEVNAYDMYDTSKGVNTEDDESDCLSDIDDTEVDGYLNNKEEMHFKKIIWEEMNKEYLEEQALKEAAAAAAAINIAELPDDLRAAHELSAAAAAAVAKSRKERQQKRASEAKNAAPAQTAAEATRQMLAKKRLSSKVNYDVLDQLFGDDAIPDSKKSRSESRDDYDDADQDLGNKDEHESYEAGTYDMYNSDDYDI